MNTVKTVYFISYVMFWYDEYVLQNSVELNSIWDGGNT